MERIPAIHGGCVPCQEDHDARKENPMTMMRRTFRTVGMSIAITRWALRPKRLL